MLLQENQGNLYKLDKIILLLKYLILFLILFHELNETKIYTI